MLSENSLVLAIGSQKHWLTKSKLMQQKGNENTQTYKVEVFILI